jgi:type I restriction enzyme S subunit
MEIAVTLGEVSTLYDSLHKTPKDYVDTGYPMIRVTDVKRGFLNFEGAKQVDLDVYGEFSKKYKPQIGDVIFTRVGSYGNSCYVDKKVNFCLGQNTVCIKPDTDRVYPYYLYTFLNSPEAKNQIDSFISGSSQPTISLKSIKEIKIELPDLEEQKKVSQVVAAYDNLIENNNRRIVILEDMAQSLYREWFVKFRFPEHEDCQFKDSPLGRIPEGWEVKKLKKITSKIGSGATPRGGKGAYKSEGTPLIRSMNIYDSKFISKNLAFIDDGQADKLKNVIVEPGDVLLNITGASVARCAIVPSAFTPARVNQHVAIIRVNGSFVCSNYVLYTLISSVGKARLLNIAQGGATREAITKAHIENFDILIPPEEISKIFSGMTSSVAREKELLFLKNENMKQQRDMLLPKLISGKIVLSS